MTDEEIAEIKLAEAWVGENVFGSDCNNLNSFEANREMVNAFLAGLKAGRPQWHDLRKDPNDLPKKDCEVVTIHETGNKNIQKWKNGNWTNAIVIPVIAWYEIQKFEETE